MEALPLHELLGILVRDLIRAETQAARATTDFLRNVGFLGDAKDIDNWGFLRFVTFSYQTSDEKKGMVVRTLRVPLLSLLPIPIQQIDTAEYEFFAKVNDVVRKHLKEKNASNILTTTLTKDIADINLLCEVAPYTPDLAQTSKIPKIHVKLSMRQSDLPAGLVSSLRRIEETSGNNIGFQKKV